MKKIFLFLIPSILEQGISYYTNKGNMGMLGIYNDLYYKRNLLYVSFGNVCISIFFGNVFKIASTIMFIFSFGLYAFTYTKWEPFI